MLRAAGTRHARENSPHAPCHRLLYISATQAAQPSHHPFWLHTVVMTRSSLSPWHSPSVVFVFQTGLKWSGLMGGLVLGWLRNEKMMGGSNCKLSLVCYYRRSDISNSARPNSPTHWSSLSKALAGWCQWSATSSSMSRMKRRAAINSSAVPAAESDVQTECKLKIISRTNLFAF